MSGGAVVRHLLIGKRSKAGYKGADVARRLQFIGSGERHGSMQ